MVSFHDAEESAYNSVRAEPLPKIHGKPTWRAKENLKNHAARQAVAFKVNYDWSGGKGLLALVIGANRLAADYPALPAYVQPTAPSLNPYANLTRLTEETRRAARVEHKIVQRDWAVVRGFCRGMSKNL